jgi:hypothetical protein
MQRVYSGIISLMIFAACSDAPYIELIVADERLPFLEADLDFDELGVEARADGCAATLVEYPPQDLPATLTVLPGDCFSGEVSLQAFALRADRRVAQSAWLELAFPGDGVLVATATLASLPGPRIRFRTGFEPGDPIGGTDEQLFVVKQRDVSGLVARADTAVFVQGARSIELRGTASSTSAHAIVRAVATDLLITENDRLSYAVRIEEGGAPATIGVDLVLDTGETAKTLALTDQSGIPIHPAASEGRVRGVWQRYIVDLSPAAPARLVGILFGFDAREGGAAGELTAHFDDLFIEGLTN